MTDEQQLTAAGNEMSASFLAAKKLLLISVPGCFEQSLAIIFQNKCHVRMAQSQAIHNIRNVRQEASCQGYHVQDLLYVYQQRIQEYRMPEVLHR